MTDTVSVHVSFDSGVSFESVLITQLDSNTYRLEETPLLSDTLLSYGDVIEAEKDNLNRLVFNKTISKAEFETKSWLFSQEIINSEEFEKFCNSVIGLGGMWERALGGFVIIHVPVSANLNLEVEIKKITEIVNSKK